MANPEHLKILDQGGGVWNRWRAARPDIRPDLTGIDLNYVALREVAGCHSSGIDLIGACMREAILVEVSLEGARLNGVDLAHAFLFNSNLKYVNLEGAILDGANLSGVELNCANLNGASMIGTEIGDATFVDVDLSTVQGLDTVKHTSSSEISISTLYKSKGGIPEIFLRGCGVPENLITYTRSLTGQALEFYKCFISFTEANDTFSERLYNDLQMRGVRCWRWKEDAKWGKTLMRSIDEAVRFYDKLIVICSEQSLNAPAVIREIERALQKEDDLARQGKEAEVLFPIRLDDYIFAGWKHHRKADVIAKNVGDFRQWHEPEKYKKAFDRLLRDLKAEEK